MTKLTAQQLELLLRIHNGKNIDEYKAIGGSVILNSLAELGFIQIIHANSCNFLISSPISDHIEKLLNIEVKEKEDD